MSTYQILLSCVHYYHYPNYLTLLTKLIMCYGSCDFEAYIRRGMELWFVLKGKKEIVICAGQKRCMDFKMSNSFWDYNICTSY